MTDNEIKKALECCFNDECEFCPNRGDKFHCFDKVKEKALDLINRQQERIEELEIITGLANNRKYYRKFVDEVFCKQKGNELSEPDFDYIYQLYFEQQAEIEQLKSLCTSKDVIIKAQEAVIDDLKHETRNLECEKGQLEGTIDFLVAEAKSEAIKEFADLSIKTICEQVSAPTPSESYIAEKCIQMINKVLAEMVGGEIGGCK